MSEIFQLTYGQVLRELRIYHDYKQKDISDYLNITCQAYSNYENNKRTPDADTLYKIAHFYHITLDQLVSYRFTRQIEDSINYGSLYHGKSTEGITIPLTANQAKMVNDILSLSDEQQEACHKFAKFLKKPTI